jgi:hypothetical protein
LSLPGALPPGPGRAAGCHLKQWRGLATRYNKLAIVYRAAALLNAVIAWGTTSIKRVLSPFPGEQSLTRLLQDVRVARIERLDEETLEYPQRAPTT